MVAPPGIQEARPGVILAQVEVSLIARPATD